jgi:hypothetical protein
VAARWGADALTCRVALDAPAGSEDALRARRATVSETVDVLALDLSGGVPDLDVPGEVELRWRHDVESVRAGAAVTREAFGEGADPGEEQIVAMARENEQDHRSGSGGALLALLDGVPVGAAGVTIAGTTARLWGAGVVPAARGRGSTALVAARLAYGREHGATLGLVKGRVDSSGPILRRTGFTAYGQERSYLLALSR